MKKIIFITILILASFLIYSVLDVPDIENRDDLVDDGEVIDDFDGKLSIIIDDLGYGSLLDEKLIGIDKPLTLAVLPSLNYTQTVINNFKDKDNFELILHMPMEPIDEIQREDFMLFSEHSKEEMEVLFNDALNQMNGEVAGLNNHKGSKFTSDSEKMREFLELVRAEDLFFIDSYTLNTSVGYSLAQEMSIPTTKRDVFLDYVDEREAIKERLYEAVDLALENGSAIAIGHYKKNTLKVLKEELPKLQKEGIKLVKASKLFGN